MTTYVALFRGVNVGGKNMLPMSELKEMFTDAGCKNVAAYIQSGNIVFRAGTRVASQLVASIPLLIEARFGHYPRMLLRTAEQLRVVIASNPFLPQGAPEDSLHVMFLAGIPHPDALKTLDPDRSKPDRFIVQNQEIYFQLPNGFARSKLTNAYFDSKLKTVSTARNWRTVLTLARMATLGVDMLHTE